MDKISQEKLFSNKKFDAARYFVTDLTIRLKELMIYAPSIDRDVLYLKLRDKKIALHVNNADDVNTAIQCFLDNHKALDNVRKTYLSSLIDILRKYLNPINLGSINTNRYADKFFRTTSQTAEKDGSKVNGDLMFKKPKPTT